MESILGFNVPVSNDTVSITGDDSFSGYKVVPWISWDDWRFVKDGLFSSSPHSSLRRVSAWRSRGCIPVVIEVTASIIEIQLKDPFFRDDESEKSLHSEEMLAMLYSMAIMRLVNGVVEKTRKKAEVSIGEAADELGIPRMLIDVRHECSHRDLPSLRLVRLASIKALDWLKFYYWEPQAMAIPSDQTINIRKEIKSVLRGLLLSFNVKQTDHSNSSINKEKRVKHSKNLFGRNKILSLKAGPKKHINKILKSFSRLYSTFSPEVVSVLLRLLLKASDSADSLSHSASSFQTALDDWKPVIIKLSNREPELFVTLLRGVLDMLETLESRTYNNGAEHFKSVEGASHIGQLSHLFEWLVISCKGLKLVVGKESAVKTSSSTELVLSNTTLVEYLRRCLKLSSGNNQLMKSALVIAHMTENSNLIYKLKKLASINNFTLHDKDESLFSVGSENYLSQQEDCLRKAAEKLEGFKQKHVKDVDANATDGPVGSRWVVAKSWNSCSIGMLPPALGSSAHLPVLDCDDYYEEVKTSSGMKELPELNDCDGKREADCSLVNLDSLCHKKMRGSDAGLESEDKESESQSLEGDHGHLMLGGMWKKVREEEILDIASDIRILV